MLSDACINNEHFKCKSGGLSLKYCHCRCHDAKKTIYSPVKLLLSCVINVAILKPVSVRMTE